MIKVQKNVEPLRPPAQQPIRLHEPGPVQAVTPQVAYRRTQVNHSGLTAADLLVMQRMVGNRQVQRMVAQRIDNANGPQQTRLAEEKHNQAAAMTAAIVQQNGPQLRQKHTAAQLERQHLPSDLIQRTPAPPSYGGVTGTRDLSRIRIDAVPDFLASSLTAPRTVNVNVSDPDVDHISWYLYDPRNFLVNGSFFSTSAGLPDATSRPFELAPSFFSGSSFLPGNYVLRSIGRNRRNHPLIYADRDFNVLTSDLTTGTALPTTYGDLTFTKYDKTDANPPTNPRFSVDVELKFLPKTTVPCNDVAFMQSLQSLTPQGQSRQSFINAEQDARKTPLAWSIDRVAGAPSPFYIAGRNPSTGGIVDVPSWGLAGRGGQTPGEATLIDQPSAAAEGTRKFEACVACRSGTNRGQVYGCATWGYTANAAGQVTLMPRSFRQMPSDQFEEARAAWNTWNATLSASNRREEAPALRSP